MHLIYKSVFISVVLVLMASDRIGVPISDNTRNQTNTEGARMKLDDEVYFEMQTKLPEPLRSAVIDIKPGELFVAAPTKVNCKNHSTILLLLAAGNTEIYDNFVPSSLNTAIVSLNLESGSLQVANAFPVDSKKTYPEAPRMQKITFFPKAHQDAQTHSQEQLTSITDKWLDLRAIDELSWKPGHYAIRILMYNRISNLSVIEIIDPDKKSEKIHGFPADKAREIEMDARRANAGSKGMWSFLSGPKTPRLDGEGTKIIIPHQVKAKDEIPLWGVARVRLDAAMIVDPKHFAGENQVISRNDLPGAVVPVYVLVSGLDQVPPLQIRIPVPYSGGELKEGQVISVSFSFSLKEALNAHLNKGTYFVYALVGQYATGPYRIDVAND